MRQAFHISPAFFRCIAATLLTAMRISLAGCLGTEEGQEGRETAAPHPEEHEMRDGDD